MTSRISASDRVQRLLSLIPWVAAHDGPTIAEVCERFGIERQQLLHDLTLASMVGVYPYTPDALVEVVVEEDRVWVYYPLAFDRPLRLTAAEALALLAAGQVLLQAPGAEPAGPLARGLAKVARSLGVEPESQVDVQIGSGAGGTLDLLDRAIRESRQVEIDYYTYGRDELTTRVVDPYRLWTNLGAWYVLARCHQAGGERQFRVDRMRAARLLETTFIPPSDGPTVAAYEPRADDPRVTIQLPPNAGWVLEQYPVDAVRDLGKGRIAVTLAISARPWLERLLLRLGAKARVVRQRGGGPDLRDAGREAARRILARYEELGRPGTTERGQ
ncbi:MAG: helix-turn-helix transcriptional regulator [Acidimicrobiales bacterium]